MNQGGFVMELEDALNKKDDEIRNDASTGTATLGGIPGRGTLQVVRGQEKEVLEVLGTWLLSDNQAGLDTSSLERAFEAGESVSYQGKLDDPEYPDRNEVEAKVKITSVQPYEFNQQQYEGEDAIEKVLYSFTVVGSLPYL